MQFEQPGSPGVLFVMQNGKVTPVRVQFGISDGRSVEVQSGINVGDHVVTGGGPAGTTSGNSQQKPGGFGGAGGLFVAKPGG